MLPVQHAKITCLQFELRDIWFFEPILKSHTVFWSKTLTTDLKICWNISVLQSLTRDSTALQGQPPIAHLWNSWGERLLLWQCRLIWGALFTPKAKHRRAEWRACLATPTRLPRILAGRQRTQDQGSPLHKYRRGRGSSGELTWGFHPREAHFRGMWLFPHLDRSPSWALCGWTEPWIDRHVPSDRFVLFWCCVSVLIALLGPDTAVGRSGWVSTHMVFCYNQNTSWNCIKRPDRGDLGKKNNFAVFLAIILHGLEMMAMAEKQMNMMKFHSFKA